MQAIQFSDDAAAIEKLLRRGLDVNEQEIEDHTLLKLALYLGRHAVVKLLLANGVDKTPDRRGYTPLLHAAAAWCDCSDAVATVLDHGADIEAKTDEGYTPLSLGVACDNLATCQLLLDRGAQINVSWKDGTLLSRSVGSDSKSEAILALLLRRGADIHLRDGQRETAMHHAALRNPKAIRTLLRHGADINAVDAAGQTPLHKAVAAHANADPENPLSAYIYTVCQETAKTLIEAGASLTIRDNQGRTPLELAEEIAISKVPVCKLLSDAEAERGVPQGAHASRVRKRTPRQR